MNALLDAPVIEPGQRGARKRLLLVAYAFPPVGGAGVQRPVKWVKYLHRAGWNVTVLTPANPSVPVLDHSLVAEVPADTVILRPRTREPGYQLKRQVAGTVGRKSWVKSCLRKVARTAASLALQPDPQILWHRNAVAAATEHLHSVPHNAILVTAPPYSSFLIGTALKHRFGLPLVLDYRDEWDLSSRYLENAPRDVISRAVQERMQRAVLGKADAVIATTQASAQSLRERLQAIGHRAMTECIYNGFDAEDFSSGWWSTSDGLETTKGRCLRLVYTGTLWNLTDIEPVVMAIERLQSRSPALAARVELVCVGRKTPEQQAVLSRMQQTAAKLVNVDYCDHSTALNWLHSADALCLLLSDVPGAERVVPAKLFEYLATQKRILAILPEGEAAGIARQFHPDGCFTPSNVSGITNWLTTALQATDSEAWHNDGFDTDAIHQYSREQQTARLIDLLEELIASSRRGDRR
jgi:glycosyltransferase involved in cell wall biosynthesis